mmetsp:Transcript_16264/g.61665  ORF Transcript_16264/g.61665 Transcript_16264/m.61665 type:complete len:246 (+) Transcript_16264:1008-1745(+)
MDAAQVGERDRRGRLGVARGHVGRVVVRAGRAGGRLRRPHAGFRSGRLPGGQGLGERTRSVCGEHPGGARRAGGVVLQPGPGGRERHPIPRPVEQQLKRRPAEGRAGGGGNASQRSQGRGVCRGLGSGSPARGRRIVELLWPRAGPELCAGECDRGRHCSDIHARVRGLHVRRGLVGAPRSGRGAGWRARLPGGPLHVLAKRRQRAAPVRAQRPNGRFPHGGRVCRRQRDCHCRKSLACGRGEPA